MRYSIFKKPNSYKLRKAAKTWRQKTAVFIVSATQVVSLGMPAIVAKQVAAATPFPSTNSLNAAISKPHVELVSSTPSSVSLQFVHGGAGVVYFEYKIDGMTVNHGPHQTVDKNGNYDVVSDADWSAHNYNPADRDTQYDGVLMLAGATPELRTFNANSKVEVRLALGGESNYRFDWTRFNVLDLGSTMFVNDPKYVRANNGGDLTAQLVTPDSTTAVNFFVDGDTATPLAGTNIGGAGATTSWWRLYTPLAAGAHTISAQIQVYGTWYDITDTGIVYSLDAPWAEYVVPQSNQFFRPNDRVVRVKADDEFNQFKRMIVNIDGNNHEVLRAA